MKIKILFATFAVLAATCSVATALDKIHVFDDKPNDIISGTIGTAGISKNAVTIQGRKVRKISVSQIRFIIFDKDPRQVSDAKKTARSGAYGEALEQFKQSAANNLQGYVKTDVEFYTLLCRAHQALAGAEPIRPVAKGLNTFIKNNGSSYHYYESIELLGDLLKADGSHANAAKFYTKLAAHPDFAMRANVALGWLSLDQKKTAEAEASFDKVLADRSSGPEADRQRHSARLGKANCLADVEEAIKMVEKVIAEADPDDWALHARTYNALGSLQNKANRKKAAIQAYLHVDLLYAQDRVQHAEALDNLIKLFTDVSQPQNANKARATLKEISR